MVVGLKAMKYGVALCVCVCVCVCKDCSVEVAKVCII